MTRQAKGVGLAIIGAGRVGLFRGEVAARHPMVDFIGVADLKQDRAKFVGDKCKATVVYKKGGAALVTFPSAPGPAHGTLEWLVQPGALREIASTHSS